MQWRLYLKAIKLLPKIRYDNGNNGKDLLQGFLYVSEFSIKLHKVRFITKLFVMANLCTTATTNVVYFYKACAVENE